MNAIEIKVAEMIAAGINPHGHLREIAIEMMIEGRLKIGE